MPDDTAVSCAKMAEPIDLPLRPKEAQVQSYSSGFGGTLAPAGEYD